MLLIFSENVKRLRITSITKVNVIKIPFTRTFFYLIFPVTFRKYWKNLEKSENQHFKIFIYLTNANKIKYLKTNLGSSFYSIKENMVFGLREKVIIEKIIKLTSL